MTELSDKILELWYLGWVRIRPVVASSLSLETWRTSKRRPEKRTSSQSLRRRHFHSWHDTRWVYPSIPNLWQKPAKSASRVWKFPVVCLSPRCRASMASVPCGIYIWRRRSIQAFKKRPPDHLQTMESNHIPNVWNPKLWPWSSPEGNKTTAKGLSRATATTNNHSPPICASAPSASTGNAVPRYCIAG